MRQIFRKQALDRLGSPEQLDQLMQVTGPRSWIALGATGLLLVAALVWAVTGTLPITVDAQGVLLRRGGVKLLEAPERGLVKEIPVSSGQKVDRGQVLVLLGSATPGGKDPAPVLSPYSAAVLTRRVRLNEVVEKGAPLLMLEPLDQPLAARLFIPVREGYFVQKPMRAQVWPTQVRRGEYGYLPGRVQFATKFPLTQEEMQSIIQNEGLVRQLSQSGPCLQANIELEADVRTASGYRWSSPRGHSIQLYSGTPCDARITISSQPPIALVFPSLGGPGGR
ncbi:MAG: hypothetical protein HY815_21430 [Candidatus Riflebacteria bacterium]|nr:hypothetical protein [Candidatus Riflebacteria bacterium]